MVSRLPLHLRSERALAEYFEGLKFSSESEGLGVESVNIVRAVGDMKELLEQRTERLRALEVAWSRYLGNPVPVEGPKAVFGYEATKEVERILEPHSVDEHPVGSHDPDRGNGNGTGRLVDFGDDERDSLDEDERDLEARLLNPSRPHILNPSRARPQFRPTIFSKRVDALDWYAEQFRAADELVKKRRKGKFRPTGVAFVTFETLAAAVSSCL